MSSRTADLESARAFQEALARMCLHASDDGCAHGEGAEAATLPAAWLTYRRLVRARLYETIEHAFERLAQRLGADAFCSLVAKFLGGPGPRTTILRRVPREFLDFLATQAGTLPAWALDLARFEWLELEVAYELDDTQRSLDTLVTGPVTLSRAVRLLDVTHHVHLLSREAPHGAIDSGAASLCIYRDPATFDTRVLELSASAAAVVRGAQCTGGITIEEAAKAAAEASDGVIDGLWLDAFATLVVDLGKRDILLARGPRHGASSGLPTTSSA